jgi:hypothetical protein
MNRPFVRPGLLALALMLSCPALAQQPQQPAAAPPAQAQPAPMPEAAPSHISACRELAISSGIVRSFDAIIEPTLAQLKQMNVTRPEVRSDLDKVVELLRPEMELQKQQMITLTARVYTKYMSEAECNQIAGFFKSPVGRKYVDTQPAVLDDIVAEMATWSQNLSEYVIIRARAEMLKLGHQLQ